MPEENKYFEAKPRSGKLTLLHMGAVAIATQNALWLAVEALATQNGNNLGPWFDELRAEAVKQAKGTISPTETPIEMDADAVQYGVDALNAAFDAYAVRLATNS